ncbi:hypothetical protein F2Q68_00040628 [Brassica cretica]|uniref:Transmembrane 9 superfamily member n=1 Tax=Brassica cretica TaxID=69181 RepID=A0A8S9MJX7_BRACR|nr:hypothetical protein F2Q68_00040628 [Brassica cretica]
MVRCVRFWRGQWKKSGEEGWEFMTHPEDIGYRVVVYETVSYDTLDQIIRQRYGLSHQELLFRMDMSDVSICMCWRGAIVTTFIVCYALTSFVSGYVSGGMYSRSGGKHWIKCMVLTASLFPFLCFGVGFLLNTIAIFYGSLAAIPFGTMVVVFVIWGFISFPLALLGTVVGRNWSGAPNNPCRCILVCVKTIPCPIPEKKWYLTPSVVSLMGGLLPFGSIFIEMYFVFTSFWNYKVYYVYGFMLLVFVILVIVTVCVTIVGTYFLLNAENYHWQWTSFLSAASTAVYVYLYSIYYYYVKTKMSGFFQISFYFGYTMMFCLGLVILCGAVGFLGSNLFLRSGPPEPCTPVSQPRASQVSPSATRAPGLCELKEEATARASIGCLPDGRFATIWKQCTLSSHPFVYYVYGFMLLVFVILVIVTVCVTIVGTYFLLNAENYHWQWTSFCPAASTAVSVYLYSFYYYYYYVKSKMSGFFQTSFYFGYTTMFCIGLGILCGAVGFLGSNLFVRRIY